MTVQNDFLPFGTGVGANVLPQSAYSSLSGRLTGFVSGVAQSQQFNKVLRQGTLAAFIMGQYINDLANLDALDDGDTATLLAHFKAAINHAIQADTPNWAGNFGGTSNALTAALSPAPAALTPGLVTRGVAPLAPTGAATFVENGIDTSQILWPDGTAIASGDWSANQVLQFLRDSGGHTRNMTPLSPTQIAAIVDARTKVGSFSLVQQPWFLAQAAAQVPSVVVGPLSSWSLTGSNLGDASFSTSNGDFTIGANTLGVWMFVFSTSPSSTVTSAASASIYATTAGVKTPLASVTVDVNSSGGFAPHAVATGVNKFAAAGEKIQFSYAQRVNTTNVYASVFGIRLAS